MISAKDAALKLREVKKLEEEKLQQELDHMVDVELENIEKDIEKAIAMCQSGMNYFFQSRNHTIQMRAIMRLENFNYVVNFGESSSSINISWDIPIETL